MKRTKVSDLQETSSRCAASSDRTREEDITSFDPLDHPLLTLARLWPNFESCPIRFYPSVVRHFYCNLTWTNGRYGIELHSYFLGHRLKITRPLLARWIGVDLCDNKTYFGHPRWDRKGDLHPRLLILHLWICVNILPKKGHMDEVSLFEVYTLSCFVQEIKLDLPTITMKEIVRIKEADGSKASGFGALLTRVFENTLILLEEELDEVCGGPLNHFAITQSKVLERINARAAQVDVDPDDVNEVVDELMNDLWGNVNATKASFSSSMTPKVFANYHREIMEGIRALEHLLRGIATTQNLHERRITGLERGMRSIRGTTDRIERHLLGLPADPVPPPVCPSRPRNLGQDYDSDNAFDLE
ncbi:hypothetical protein Dimus_021181 [Dionaea muscipula]